MNPRLLRYYNQELQFLREMGGEFAREFPKIAGRLGMDGFEVADPYVERLLEGFAFLAARVQLKLDDEFPRFTQHLLEMVYPHYLAPTPSMAVVRLAPNPREGALAGGVTIPRDTVLRGPMAPDEQTACEYRTAHPTTLWPLELTHFEYSTHLGGLGGVRLSSAVRAVARVRLRATGGLRINQLALDRLPVFLRGEPETVGRLYEQLHGRAVAVIARPPASGGGGGGSAADWQEVLADAPVRPAGFADEQALLPYTPRSFQGYRLLHEYFAFPQRYHFAEFVGLGPAVRRCAREELELLVLFDRAEPALENAVDASNLALFCTPAINLFPRSADRIHLTDARHDHHVVPDRTRPMDFEVYAVRDVVGHGSSAEARRRFWPFYAHVDSASDGDEPAYYTLRREPRRLSERQRAHGARSSYVGSEVFLALVDGDEGPYRTELKQLGVDTLCTNRDLPLHMPLGQGRTDFTLESGAPVDSVRVLAGPTPPRPSHAHGEFAWRLVSHLSLNYLSLVDSPDGRGAAALRDLLGLYADLANPALRKQIDAVQSVASQPVIRHVAGEGPIAYARGVEVALACDEGGFEGGGAFLLGAVLERFFARYVTINSFTETVLRTIQRGEVMRWPARPGQTPAL